MSRARESLLGQIEAGVLDDSVPVASLLQKVIVLGGRAGSAKMRDWARRELNGYEGEPFPPYRKIYTGLTARLTNLAGYNPVPQRIRPSDFPEEIRDFLRGKGVDLETAILAGGVGELEALASRGESEYRLIPPWGESITNLLNEQNQTPGTRVDSVYWSVSDAALRGLLVRVRTALAELIAELIAVTPADQDMPDKDAVDNAVTFVLTGDRPTINVTSQQTHGGGTNVAAAPSEGGTVAVSGTGTAVGSQTASGAGSSVVGSQSARGSRNSVTGRDGAAADSAGGQGWWARLRKRGWVVAVSTILGGLAGVGALVVALFTWLGWAPWWR